MKTRVLLAICGAICGVLGPCSQRQHEAARPLPEGVPTALSVEIEGGKDDEYLVLRPFQFHESEVPENLRKLEREVSQWIAAGKRSDADITIHTSIVPTGDAVVAWVQNDTTDVVLSCRVWRLLESGDWITMQLPLPDPPVPRKSSGSFLITEDRVLFDLRLAVPSKLVIPKNITGLRISPVGHWVGREDNHYVAGTVEGNQLKRTFPVHLDSQWDRELAAFPRVYWLSDYDVAIIGKNALVDFEKHTIKPIELPKTPLMSIGSPPAGDLICHAEEGYVRFEIGRDGSVEELDDNWSVQPGDQLWASSPSGIYLGGRRTSLVNLLPGGVGPDVIRVNHNLAPDGTKAPSLGGASFVGWVVDRPNER